MKANTKKEGLSWDKQSGFALAPFTSITEDKKCFYMTWNTSFSATQTKSPFTGDFPDLYDCSFSGFQ